MMKTGSQTALVGRIVAWEDDWFAVECDIGWEQNPKMATFAVHPGPNDTERLAALRAADARPIAVVVGRVAQVRYRERGEQREKTVIRSFAVGILPDPDPTADEVIEGFRAATAATEQPNNEEESW